MILVPLINLALHRLPSLSRRSVTWSSEAVKRLRRHLVPTHEELDRRYLEEARDLYDLEWRMRELDRPRQTAHDPFHLFRNRSD